MMMRKKRGSVSRLCSSLFLFCVLGLCFALLPRGLRAQESPNPEEYTVIAGDTVSAIATKFGVSVDAITSVNGLVDPALIQIGQTLIIPAADGSLPISAIDVGMLHARPGESLHQIARRSGQEPSLIAALNNRSAESRLFPGEPVAVPAAAQIEPFRFGAITQIDYPAEIVQGQTALLTMQSRRAISLSISLGTQPLPVFSAAPHQYWTFLPVSALHTPQIILLQLRYFTASGLEVERSLPIEVRSGEYVHQNVWIPDEKFALLAPEVIDEEEQRLAPIWSTLTTPLNAAAGFRRPIAEQYITTSRFGDRRSYNDGFYTSYHSGQDFGAPQAVTVTIEP